jgi:hypothetical protein
MDRQLGLPAGYKVQTRPSVGLGSPFSWSNVRYEPKQSYQVG